MGLWVVCRHACRQVCRLASSRRAIPRGAVVASTLESTGRLPTRPGPPRCLAPESPVMVPKTATQREQSTNYTAAVAQRGHGSQPRRPRYVRGRRAALATARRAAHRAAAPPPAAAHRRDTNKKKKKKDGTRPTERAPTRPWACTHRLREPPVPPAHPPPALAPPHAGPAGATHPTHPTPTNASGLALTRPSPPPPPRPQTRPPHSGAPPGGGTLRSRSVAQSSWSVATSSHLPDALHADAPP